jgi:hypothetical protein
LSALALDTISGSGCYRRGPIEYAFKVNNLTDTDYFAS